MSQTLPPLASTPEPPYYAVIFTTQRTDIEDGYAQTAEQMVALASTQSGFLGTDSVRDTGGAGITVSYWRDLAAIAAWRDHSDHIAARNSGRARWYRAYTLRIACVERAYDWDAVGAS